MAKKKKKFVRPKTEEEFFELYKDVMTSIGTYRWELDHLIMDLARLEFIKEKNYEEWQANGCAVTTAFENTQNKTNIVKSQWLQNEEQLLEKILKVKKELGLTAYNMDKMGKLEKKTDDTFATFMIDQNS